MVIRRLALPALVLALSLVPRPLRAEVEKPDPAIADTSRELFVQAMGLLEKKKYAECHAKAKAAYGIHAHPQITGLIGECAHGAGKWREAAEMLTAFLAVYETKRARPMVDAWLAMLSESKKHIGILRLRVAPEAATIRQGEAVVGRGKAVLFLEPGAVTLRVEAGEHKDRVVTESVAAGEDRELEVKLERLVAGPPPSPGPSGPVWPKWPLVGVGAGLAAVGVGVGVGLLAAGDAKLGEAATLRATLAPSACAGGGGAACAQLAEANRAADTLLNAGFWLAVTGGVFAVGTVVLAVIPAGGAKPAQVRLSPVPGGVWLDGSF